jgi:alcohol dehydrogenase
MKIHGAVLHTMGAATPYAQSKPLAIEAVELDAPGPGEVLVKIAAAGLCHSDLSVINGDRPRPTPMLLGHEAAGIVEAIGQGVDDLKHGDHVVMVFVPSCGGHTAERHHEASPQRPAAVPPPGLLGLCRVRDGVAPLAGEDRS